VGVKLRVYATEEVVVGVKVHDAVLETSSETFEHPEMAEPLARKVIFPATLEVALNVADEP
jgi:hypothetical protein